MKISSADFKDGGLIHSRHASYSTNIAPQLEWSDIPAKARSLVLICDDPDAMKPVGRIWVHWVVYDISPTSTGTPFSKDVLYGLTDFGARKYDGPNPPDQQHKYYFELFALDVPHILLEKRVTRVQFRKKYQDHIIDSCVLSGVAVPQSV